MDDDEDVRSVVALALHMDGHVVAEAATVPSGIEKLATWAPSLVITDMSFGAESGERVVEACRLAGCLVMVMTASVSDDVLRPMAEAGTPVLIKPFSMDALITAVRELLP